MRNDDEIDRYTLMFESPGLETGFMLSRYQRLSEWTTIMMILVFANCAFYSLAHNFWSPDQYPTDAAVSASKWQAMIFLGGTAIVEVLLLVNKTLACSHKPLRNVVVYMECTMSVCCLIMMVVTVGMNRHYLARMLGHDDAEAVWGRDLGYVDGLNLIILNLCAQCAHLAPIRWAVLFPLEVALVLVFELPIHAWGSPAPEAIPFFTICAVWLAGVAAAGKRQIEWQDRLLFKGLLAEKKLRFEAEHELAMRKESTDPTTGPRSLDESSAVESRPETTPSALAFDMDGVGSLEEVRAVGVREQWLIEDVEVTVLPDRVLGRGGFGVVVEGLYHNTLVALKSPRQDTHMELAHESLLALCNELRVLRRLRHPNIVFLYGATMAPCFERLCLVLEHIDGVLLRHFIQPEVVVSGSGAGTRTRQPRGCTATVNDRTSIVCDILNALRYLHSRTPTVVHGDLKDSNIFVQQLCSTAARAKLLDFGLARLLTRSAEPLGGTARWMAPELFARKRARPDMPADVYSVGLLMFFVATGSLPFKDANTEAVTRRRVRRLPVFLSWPDGSAGLQDMQRWCCESVQRCTQVRPERRPSVAAVCDELARGLNILNGAEAADAEDDLSAAYHAPVGPESPERCTKFTL